MNPQTPKTSVSALLNLPLQCPVAFVEAVVLEVYNRRTPLVTSGPRAGEKCAFQEILLGDVENPAIKFPCIIADINQPEVPRTAKGVKISILAHTEDNGGTKGVKIHFDTLKDKVTKRNVLWVTGAAAIMGLPLGGQPASVQAVQPPHQPAPTPPPQPQPQPSAARPQVVPPAIPAADATDLRAARRYYGRLGKLLAVSARAVDNANEAYMKISDGNQFSQELKDSATISFFLAGFKDYGKTSGLDAQMPDVGVEKFVELLKK